METHIFAHQTCLGFFFFFFTRQSDRHTHRCVLQEYTIGSYTVAHLPLCKEYPHLADNPGSLFTNNTQISWFILIIGLAIMHSIPSFRTFYIDVHGHLPIMRIPIKLSTRLVWRVRTSHRLRRTRSSVCKSLTSSPSLAGKVCCTIKTFFF